MARHSRRHAPRVKTRYEGDSGAPRAIVVPVTLSAPMAGHVTVEYVVLAKGLLTQADVGTAFNQIRTLRFKPNSDTGLTATTASIVITAIPDVEWELDENVVIRLLNPTGGYGLGRDEGFGFIRDDDDPADGSSSIQALAVAGSSLCEGDDAPLNNRATFQVTLQAPATTATGVLVAVADAGATAGEDYESAGVRKVRFEAGEVQRQVTLTTHADTDAEDDEFVSGSITSPPVAMIGGGTSLVGILDDDGP